MVNSNDKLKNIHSGHRERLRNKLSSHGIYELDDITFLEYLLTFVITRADTNPIAHSLLNEFGSIEEIFNANLEGLLSIKGIGVKTARFIQYMSSVAFMYNKSKALKNPKVDTIRKLSDFIKNILPPSENEQLVFIILNKNLTVKNYKVFKGISHSYITLDVNEVTEYLIKHKASFCAIAHTHPKHKSNPSSEDLIMFKNLNLLLDALSIVLIENMIIGEDGIYSLKNKVFYGKDLDKNFINSKNYNNG